MYPKLWDHVTFWDDFLYSFQISLYKNNKTYDQETKILSRNHIKTEIVNYMKQELSETVDTSQ